MSDSDIVTGEDWDNRVLCSDESCIGVIGTDGRCKECGRPYDGPLPTATTEVRGEPADVPGSDSSGAGEVPDSETDTEASINAADSDEWESRTLCRDEACIGVIGPDGRCKECGLEY